MSEVVHKNAADSYGAVAKQQAATGTRSDTLLTPFRNYNNYVKKALVQQAMSVLIDTSSSPPPTIVELDAASANTSANQSLHYRLLRGFRHQEDGEVVDGFSVLDIASGRGGDLNKWLYGQHPPVSSSVVSSRTKIKDPSARAPLFRKSDDDEKKWICTAPKEHPVYVANVTSVDISPGAVEIGLERFKNAITVDVAPGTKIHDSMVKSLREGRELPPAQFFVSNCLSPAFWLDADPSSSSKPASTTEDVEDPRLRQSVPDVSETVHGVKSTILTKLRPSASTAFPFDIISVQFAFHYACETYESMQANLAGMYSTLVAGKPITSSSLATVPRGVLVLTTVDAVAITKRLRGAYRELYSNRKKSSDVAGGAEEESKPSSSKITEVTYSSKLFSLTLPVCTPEIEEVLMNEDDEGSSTLPLGTRYHFKLEGHVDCDEFVVPYTDLVRAATTGCSGNNTAQNGGDDDNKNHNFTLLDSHSFTDSRQYLHEFNTTPKYKRQMDGKSLEADDLDLIGIYRTYVFGAY